MPRLASRLLPALLLCAAWSLTPAPTHAIDATLEATSGGVVITENPDPSSPNQVPVTGLGHNVTTPRDAASGLPTGRRQHKPFTITKPVDKATPLLFKACTSSDVVESAIVRLYRSDATGVRVHYFTYELEDAIVVGCSTGGSAGGDVIPTEQISFTYGKITWTWTDGTIEHSDDWVAPQ